MCLHVGPDISSAGSVQLLFTLVVGRAKPLAELKRE